ncbi:MAG: tetratricopeptide repeat protein [Candidatus Methanoplasma sp.]|jgi:tetratricopeptide (TPR) repeat protein|nr:tetratricopeptide repeat protein [Candidatus Methanoplasma sp.]
MGAPAGCFRITHGSLTVSVPRSLFRGAGAEADPSEEAAFRATLSSRYPWLKKGSLDVIMENARREALRIMDEESHGRLFSGRLEASGMRDEAIAHLKRRLERDPGDADAWYALGEALCRAGRAEEGYAAFARGRSLF